MQNNPNRQRLFDHWSATYNADVVDETSFPFIGYNLVLDTLVQLATFQPQHTVLDVGIGTGNLASRIPIPQEQISGVDFSQKMLELAAKNLPECHFYQADLLSQSYPHALKGPFDRIVSGYTLHEFSDKTKINILLKLSEKFLRGGGEILIGDISFLSQTHLNQAYQKLQPDWDEEETYWCAEHATNLLQQAGFWVEYHQLSICGGVYHLKPGNPSEA